MSVADHPLYSTYAGMKKRVLCKTSQDYIYYGGRGIKVCQRWLEPRGAGFKNFIADMGERPNGYTLDRKDNDGNYTPENCRWATRQQQGLNRRKQSNNTSGTTGVSYIPSLKRWVVFVGNKSVYGGNNRLKAIQARTVAIEKHNKTIAISTNLC